jgi:hypothetical protein
MSTVYSTPGQMGYKLFIDSIIKFQVVPARSHFDLVSKSGTDFAPEAKREDAITLPRTILKLASTAPG